MNEEIVKFQQFEFVGYIYKRNDTKWGTDVRLRTLADDGDEKYPQHILVTVSKKKLDKLGDAGVGDKVKMIIIPSLVEGVSDKTQKAYAINKLNLKDCEILERAEAEQSDDDGIGDDDVPF